MNRRQRRNHSSNFKAKVAIEALKEQKTLSQIASQYSLHQHQISDWKRLALERLHELYEKPGGNLQTDIESITAPLYQQIGQLKVELDFLKKKSGITGA
jgi:putative transposase